MKKLGSFPLLLMFLSLVLPVSVSAQNQLNLSGVWTVQGGSVVKISQDGQKIKMIFVKLRPQSRSEYGFNPGDEDVIGTLEGRSLRGKRHLRLPVSWKSICPKQWDSWTEIALTVSEDGNTLQGQWEQKQTTYTGQGCTFTPKQWVPITYTRVTVSLTAEPARPGSDGPVRFTTRVTPIVDSLEYRFDFGEGGRAAWARESTAAYSYSKPGTYHATGEVRIGGATLIGSDTLRIEIPRSGLVGWATSLVGLLVFLAAGSYVLRRMLHSRNTFAITANKHLESQSVEIPGSADSGFDLRVRAIRGQGEHTIEAHGPLVTDGSDAHG